MCNVKHKLIVFQWMLFKVLFINMQENTLASDDTLAHFFNDFLSLPVKLGSFNI